MSFLQVILKNLMRRKTRTALTSLGIGVAVGAMILMVSVSWKFAESTMEYYSARDVDIIVVRAGVTERITSSLRKDLATQIAAVKGVAEVDYSLTEMVSFGDGNLIGIPLRGLNPEGFSRRQLAARSGRIPTVGDLFHVALGTGLAESLHKTTGDSMEIEGKKFEVVGILAQNNPLETNSSVTTLQAVQTVMDRPNQVSEFHLRVDPQSKNEATIRQVCTAIESMRDEKEQLLGLKAQPVQQFIEQDSQTRLTKAMAWSTTILSCLLSITGMTNTMLMSVLERTAELGVLRAIGWSRRRVVTMILCEAVLLSIIGVVFGVILAWGATLWFANWSVTASIVQPRIAPFAIVVGSSIALIAGVVGACYPAYRGSGIHPTEALRYA